MKLLVTGGAGFIGSALVRRAVAEGLAVVNVDKLTYAASLDNVAAVTASPLYAFERADIGDRAAMTRILAAHAPDAVAHLAAETHVDRSIDAPAVFVETNVAGSCVLLEAARAYWSALPAPRRAAFRFLHVSTDEVYGALGPEGRVTERSPYAPTSPYAASKAASDHLARAWRETYGLPVLITNGANTYGPRQFPEKLIPVVILNARAGRPIPVYGRGENVRDWLFVDDHAAALLSVLRRGRVGESYNVGGAGEARNIDVAREICAALDRLRPAGAPHDRLIAFVTDRPGHDFRYAVDSAKITAELGWTPSVARREGIERTVRWYLDNESWLRALEARGCVGGRIGLGGRAAPGEAG